MERLSVDDMKAIELDIMDEIDRVCTAHGVATGASSRGTTTWTSS